MPSLFSGTASSSGPGELGMVVLLAPVVGLIGVAIFYGLMRLMRGPELAASSAKRFALIWIPLHVVVAVVALVGRD
jgi:hypothetical protein